MMIPLLLPQPDDLSTGPRLSVEASAFVDHLRRIAMRCRAKPRAALFEACALLQTEKSASVDAYADALMRCLNEALGKPARLQSPGTSGMTFDERWLLQLGLACARQDDASCQFLLGSRISLENRRLVRFLVEHIAEGFELI